MSERVKISTGGLVIANNVRAETLIYEERGFPKFRGAVHLPPGFNLPDNFVIILEDGTSKAVKKVSNPETPRTDADGNYIYGFLSDGIPDKKPSFRGKP